MKNFDRFSSLIEFDKVLNVVASFAHIEGTKEKILSTRPSSEPSVVRRLLAETTKAKELIVYKATPPFGRVPDIVSAVERAEKSGVLSMRELLDVASLLRSVSSVKKYTSLESTGVLIVYFSSLQENTSLEHAITKAIVAEDIIADDATDVLYRIRRDMRKTESSIRDILAKYTSGHQSKYLQENIVTIRSGRYVIPVKAEYKNEVKGLLHDTSSSGATMFIEPMAVVEANNKLRELRAEEQAEIERILYDLSAQVGGYAYSIILNYTTMIDLAAIFARAEYSLKIDATEPEIVTDELIIDLVNARHPLLPKDKVVPISVMLGDKVKTLVITGPNTGGKTVTLKTLGLMASMAACGLHLPCDPETRISVFSSIYPDIGDEQSIEQSLSTFSSHMVNIVKILNECDERSLVLIDELGAGTDPEEGAALAIAILEKIKSKGSVTAATTHYAELKFYALEHDEVLNACCEFDVETLRPTYRLITGLPGKSNAFAISSRLGISDDIIYRAKELINEENVKFNDILTKLEETEMKLEKERNLAETARLRAAEIVAEAEKKAEERIKAAEAEVQKAKNQAAGILASAKASSEYVFDMINKLQKEKERRDIAERLDETRREIKSRISNASSAISALQPKEDENYKLPRPLKLGDTVELRDMQLTATVLGVDGDTVSVKVGNIKTKTPLSNLKLISEQPKQKKTVDMSTVPHRKSSVKPEIDLRGQTVEEACEAVDTYLYEAIDAGYATVTLIHGKGTGVLRAAIADFIKRDRRVRSFRLGRYGEGETGVTIVELATR